MNNLSFRTCKVYREKLMASRRLRELGYKKGDYAGILIDPKNHKPIVWFQARCKEGI